MPIERSPRSLAPTRITTLARRLLDSSTLCAISTVTPRGRAHVNTAYFAFSPEFEVIWMSDPGAQHSRNLGANPSAAIAVYDSSQQWGRPDRGIQLFGAARELASRAAREGERVYARRFPQSEPVDSSAYSFYRFRPRRMKLFDESELGAGVFVTATIRSGRVVWERTDVYKPASDASASAPVQRRLA
jgi:uncharacterized protein YhbP (UPF0306 family)